MVWFYTRDAQSLTVETRYDNDTHEYVATIIGLTPAPDTTRFGTQEEFRTSLETLERELASHGWKLEGPPHILPDGWPDTHPKE